MTLDEVPYDAGAGLPGCDHGLLEAHNGQTPVSFELHGIYFYPFFELDRLNNWLCRAAAEAGASRPLFVAAGGVLPLNVYARVEPANVLLFLTFVQLVETLRTLVETARREGLHQWAIRDVQFLHNLLRELLWEVTESQLFDQLRTRPLPPEGIVENGVPEPGSAPGPSCVTFPLGGGDLQAVLAWCVRVLSPLETTGQDVPNVEPRAAVGRAGRKGSRSAATPAGSEFPAESGPPLSLTQPRPFTPPDEVRPTLIDRCVADWRHVQVPTDAQLLAFANVLLSGVAGLGTTLLPLPPDDEAIEDPAPAPAPGTQPSPSAPDAPTREEGPEMGSPAANPPPGPSPERPVAARYEYPGEVPLGELKRLTEACRLAFKSYREYLDRFPAAQWPSRSDVYRWITTSGESETYVGVGVPSHSAWQKALSRALEVFDLRQNSSLRGRPISGSVVRHDQI